jgi:catechol 2,3-dioxygenase-like lactoylglutathione lyase family enzyme
MSTHEDTTTHPTARAFRVTTMNHPSHHVPDLDEAESFFRRVYGCGSIGFAEILGAQHRREDWPMDYSIFTLIRDVLMDSIDPQRYVVGGIQQYETVTEGRLKDFGWYVDGLTEAFRAVKAQGFRVTNTLFEIQDGDEPTGPNQPAPFFTLREDAGLRYHFHSATHVLPGDPRRATDWVLPPVAPDDPLGIECCSHHTVLTAEPGRALRLFVDALGAAVVHEGRDESQSTTSTYVHLAGSTLEFAIPDAGTAAHADWAKHAPEDTYHAITWKVTDLDRAEDHLRAQGVHIAARTGDTLVTDPATSLGIPWGFTSALIEGDPRGAA